MTKNDQGKKSNIISLHGDPIIDVEKRISYSLGNHFVTIERTEGSEWEGNIAVDEIIFCLECVKKIILENCLHKKE